MGVKSIILCITIAIVLLCVSFFAGCLLGKGEGSSGVIELKNIIDELRKGAAIDSQTIGELEAIRERERQEFSNRIKSIEEGLGKQGNYYNDVIRSIEKLGKIHREITN